ncbi:MAG: ABC-2 type transporter [Methanomassiliicoccales archaeon PtaU1.Bin124]|nr:MAG: ABC-2 type transporter [Methanomassiliicoccales archaeon PtaU1.Bin124]
MESNWTSPWLFLVYSVVKPIFGTLILVFMYLIILGGVQDQTLFSFMFIGNAFYMFVAQTMFGVAYVVQEDRERFKTLKQVYIAPISYFMYIVGRAISKLAITALAVVITLIFGVAFLNVGVDLGATDWLLFGVGLFVGLLCVVVIGVALAGITFLTARHSSGINEGIAGLFYLFCGVVYPMTVLPSWGQTIGMAIPFTYWLEMMRRALAPGTDFSAISGLGGYSNLEITALLLATTVVFLIISVAIFRYADHLARKKGKLDMNSTY